MLSSFGISRGPFSYLIMLLIGIGAFVVIGLLSAQEQAFLQKSVLVDGKVTSFVKDDLKSQKYQLRASGSVHHQTRVQRDVHSLWKGGKSTCLQCWRGGQARL